MPDETKQPTTSTSPGPEADKPELKPGAPNAPGLLSNIPIGKFPEWWRKATVNPIGSMLASGALVGVPTYFAAPWIARKMYEKISPTLSPEARAEWAEELRTKGRSTQWRLALASASLPMALTLLQHWNPKDPAKSLTRWNYAD
jgi:hypothetical protein